MEEKNAGPSPLVRFIRLLNVDRKDILYIYLFAAFSGLISLSLPLGVQAVVNLIMVGQTSTSWYILIALVVGGVLLNGVLQIYQISLTEVLQQRVFARAAIEFTYRIPHIKHDAVYFSYPPELMNRFFDSVMVQKGLPKVLIDIPSALLQTIFGLILLSLYHPIFILFGVILLFMLVVIFYVSGPRGLATSLTESKYKYKVAHWLEELARTLTTFKLAGPSNLPLKRVDQLLTSYLGARKSHFQVLLFQYWSVVAFKTLVTGGLLLLGGILVMQQSISLGQFVAAEIVILLVMNSIEKLIAGMDTVYDTLTAVEKIGSVTDLPLDDSHGYDFSHYDKGLGMELGFRHVSHSFPDKKLVISDLNIIIDPGEKVCLVGGAGSGKSTLLQLMGALYRPSSGVITYNGATSSELEVWSVRAVIGDCLAQEDIFQGSLEENVAIGRQGVTFHDVLWALDMAGLGEWCDELPEGLQTQLDPEGRKYPRSVVQRIILARAIAARPKLLLLEEALTAIPAPQRNQVIKNITAPNVPWTLVAITSDVAMAQASTRILVLNKGRVQYDVAAREVYTNPAIGALFNSVS